MIKFGERIRKYREMAGISQEKLAEKCGWFTDEGRGAQSRIGNYEREDRQPALDDLDKIAESLGVTIVHLLSDPAEPASSSDDELAVQFQRLRPGDQEIMLNLIARLCGQ